MSLRHLSDAMAVGPLINDGGHRREVRNRCGSTARMEGWRSGQAHIFHQRSATLRELPVPALTDLYLEVGLLPSYLLPGSLDGADRPWSRVESVASILNGRQLRFSERAK